MNVPRKATAVAHRKGSLSGHPAAPLARHTLSPHRPLRLSFLAASRESRMSSYELAQLNIGIIRGPMDSPVMAEFAANLERINALAERSPGFVWRLQTPAGNATDIRPFENES